MQEHKAREIREAWGDRPCPHPAFDRLTLGGRTDGYVCIRCAREFTQDEKEQAIAQRKAEAQP